MPKDQPRAQQRPYHHGDLRAALLAEAERILQTEGIEALTLRAAARGVGVSHAAPTNHFGDLTGLLSELAAVGYDRFSQCLEAAPGSAGDDPRARSHAMGRAYVDFARRYPALFVLMFRSERLDDARPALYEAILRARRALSASAPQLTSPETTAPSSALRMAAEAAARWSLVHGFAMLQIDGRLADIVGSLPPGETVDTLLDEVLDTTRVGEW